AFMGEVLGGFPKRLLVRPAAADAAASIVANGDNGYADASPLDGDRLGQFQIDALLVIGSSRDNQALGRIVSSTLSTKQQN
ncbi:MAG: hypothetical protein VXV74_00780, partial [Pseudomonadota bacterium]|nr:hypothetical protein [Pseudomonadota bacterium]